MSRCSSCICPRVTSSWMLFSCTSHPSGHWDCISCWILVFSSFGMVTVGVIVSPDCDACYTKWLVRCFRPYVARMVLMVSEFSLIFVSMKDSPMSFGMPRPWTGVCGLCCWGSAVSSSVLVGSCCLDGHAVSEGGSLVFG